MRDTVFTLGHSTHTEERFVELLRQHGITAVCDVRSTPHSRMHPQFNRESLQRSLADAGIQYVFLGAELGARSGDAACYERGRVVYGRLARTEAFQRGIERIREGLARGFRPALVCAEKEPLECHRTILVARRLAERGIGVQHIHADGRLESHAEAMARLARELGIEQPHLFRSDAEAIEEAYRLQEERIAYTAAAPEGSAR